MDSLASLPSALVATDRGSGAVSNQPLPLQRPLSDALGAEMRRPTTSQHLYEEAKKLHFSGKEAEIQSVNAVRTLGLRSYSCSYSVPP